MTLYKAACHCGVVKFEVEGEIDGLVECNCSICARRAHILWFVLKSEIEFISGEDNLTAYQFGKKHITHRFCKTCGSSMLSDGEQDGVVKAGINIRNIADIDVSAFETFKYDGKNL